MTNETIGHYASRPGGGTVGWNKGKGFHGDIRVGASQLNKSQPSDLELRIRKEVMDDVNKMIEYEADKEEYHKSILLRIKDRLKLLWGSNE